MQLFFGSWYIAVLVQGGQRLVLHLALASACSTGVLLAPQHIIAAWASSHCTCCTYLVCALTLLDLL